MKNAELLSQLSAAPLTATVLAAPGLSAGRLIVTPHGARVLGAFTHSEAENAFFSNPELVSSAAAKSFLAGEHVLGGDRVWIAPERGLFFKGDKLADGVVTQASIDPGNWRITAANSSAISFANDFVAAYFHDRMRPVIGRVERNIRLISNPFAFAPDVLPAIKRVNCVGYEIASRFDLLQSPQDDLYFGLWFLIQFVVPHGGYIYAPTNGHAVITDYYEPTGSDYLHVTDNYVRFKADSINRHKIGIRKIEATGRMAFLSQADPRTGNATLIVRNFHNNPSANYADVPLSNPAGTQDSIQFYNHYSGPAGFAELEFHSPGVCRAMPDPSVTDTHQVWIFAGARTDLVEIACRLLNLSSDVLSV